MKTSRTNLKDWAEILYIQKDFVTAEQKFRLALELLEEKDSDAFFSLGQILSAPSRDKESIDSSKKSFELNGDGAGLLYNLGIKLGEKIEDDTMYAKATKVDRCMAQLGDQSS